MTERTVLRPVTISPQQSALVYMLVLAADIPGARVHDASSLLREIEAAMSPLPDDVNAVLAELEPHRSADEWTDGRTHSYNAVDVGGELTGDD